MNIQRIVLTAALGLVLTGHPTTGASADPPATPVTPQPTAAPPTAPTPTSSDSAGAPGQVSVNVATVADPTTADGKAWSDVFMVGANAGLPDTRVTVEYKDAKLKDALKDALDEAKLDFVFDQDIPEDVRVTLKLDKVKIATVLDAITDSGEVHWRAETRDGKKIVHVGKKIKYGEMSLLPYRDLNAQYSKVLSDALPKGFTIPDINGNRTYSLSTPTLNTLRSRETRSTFTCPNCHNQVTIVRKNVAPVCPTCQRAFEPGWKVCPYDGTKRPEAKDDWKFCPVCGKPIPDGTVTDNLESDAWWNNLPALNPTKWSIKQAEDALHEAPDPVIIPDQNP